METKFKIPEGADTLDMKEWAEQDGRTNEAAWDQRYQYEAHLISSLIDDKVSTILELGSG
jgi:hypothetical protein